MPTTLDNETVLDRRPRLKEACRQLQDMAEELGAEAKLPTLVELRDQLGISMQTLSDAVRELEKRRVLKSVHGVGIYVADRKPKITTGNVGFISSNKIQEVSYWGAVLFGVRSALSASHYNLLLIDIDSDAYYEQCHKVDGALMFNTHNLQDPAAPPRPKKLPFVSLFHEVDDAPCVTTDDFSGVYQSTQHLIQLGHQRIAYLGVANVGQSLLDQRKAGYIKALEDAGIEPDSRFARDLIIRREWYKQPHQYTMAGEYYVRQWLEENWRELGCTALIVQNDLAALGAITAFQAAGMDVPGDVSVVGYDGLPLHAGEPHLTTVEVPLQRVGETATKALLQWLKDPGQVPQRVVLPVNFIAGQTAAAPLKATPLLTTA